MGNSWEQLLDAFLREADGAGIGAYTAVLYGSAARGQHIPGWSDLNLMLLLDSISLETLRALGQPFGHWRKAKLPPPFLLSKSEWSRAADVFPVEIADMRTAYRVLRGGDPLAGIALDPADLRTGLEREFRGKLMRLRSGFTSGHAAPAELSLLARRSVGSILVLLRGLLVLRGEAVPPDPEALTLAAGRTAGFDAAAIQRVAERRASTAWRPSLEEFAAYLVAVESAARFVDQLQLGER